MKYEITKEQIEKIAEEDQKIKIWLREWFPEAFEKEFEVGKWYRCYNPNDNFFNDVLIRFIEYTNFKSSILADGFASDKKWHDKAKWFSDKQDHQFLVEATDDYIESYMKKLMEEKGFVPGVKFNAVHCGYSMLVDPRSKGCVLDSDYIIEADRIQVRTPHGTWENNQSNPYIFRDGVWAEIIRDTDEVDQLSELKKSFAQLEIEFNKMKEKLK